MTLIKIVVYMNRTLVYNQILKQMNQSLYNLFLKNNNL
nr:MAG TPA: hypothetical protein [Caudoviricetes sp.]